MLCEDVTSKMQTANPLEGFEHKLMTTPKDMTDRSRNHAKEPAVKIHTADSLAFHF
jgi:hypothetical protein